MNCEPLHSDPAASKPLDHTNASFPELAADTYGGGFPNIGRAMRLFRFQCPDCGLGDYETGHLVAADEIYCVVCLEEDGRLIGLECWDEKRRQLRPACGKAWSSSPEPGFFRRRRP